MIRTTVPGLPWQNHRKKGCDKCGQEGVLRLTPELKFLCEACRDPEPQEAA